MAKDRFGYGVEGIKSVLEEEAAGTKKQGNQNAGSESSSNNPGGFKMNRPGMKDLKNFSVDSGWFSPRDAAKAYAKATIPAPLVAHYGNMRDYQNALGSYANIAYATVDPSKYGNSKITANKLTSKSVAAMGETQWHAKKKTAGTNRKGAADYKSITKSLGKLPRVLPK
tara:strand:+ start:4233 stop:4739 length:507 start_codon:yes stop_codon:yes gene_type:complete